MNHQGTSHSSHNLQIKLMTNSVLAKISFLGFDIQANEKQHKIILNATTFAKPNPKGNYYLFIQFKKYVIINYFKLLRLLFIFCYVSLMPIEHNAHFINVGHQF